jgi:hypothetical protein
MPPTNSQVPRIELNTSGTISLMVDVYGFDTGTLVEVSGQLTQENGAIASFRSVQPMPDHEDEVPARVWVRDVSAETEVNLDPALPITVVARSSVAWITVLGGEGQPGSGVSSRTQDPAGAGAIQGAWNSRGAWSVLAVSPATGSPQAGPAQSPAAAAAAPS